MAIKKKTIDVYIDTDSPYADLEELVLMVQHSRAKVEFWTERLKVAEAELGSILYRHPKTGQSVEDLSQPPKKRKPGRRAAERPTGANAEAICDIAERGEISAEDLVLILFDDDTRENRKKVYSRIRHWKQKGWLGQLEDGSWGVPTKLAEELQQENPE